MSDPIYTPKSLRDLADAEQTPFRLHLMDEYRKALRWSANVIEAANEVIEENRRAAIATQEGGHD